MSNFASWTLERQKQLWADDCGRSASPLGALESGGHMAKLQQ